MIASGAPLWLLDEPLTALDAASCGLFAACLAAHRAAGGLTAVSTHDPVPAGAGVIQLSLIGEAGLPLPSGRGAHTRRPVKRYFALLRRELRLAARQGWQLATTLFFFLLVIVLLAFGVGPDPALLQPLAPGAVWVAALLACLLSLDRLWAVDAADGSLDALLAAPVPRETLAFAKMSAHWLTTGLPLAIVSPLGGLLLHLPAPALVAMPLALALGTPVLSLVGGAVAALAVGARRGGLLLALLALPLYVPVLIFGAGGVSKALAATTVTAGLADAAGPLAFVAALLAAALPLAPLAAAAALGEE